MSQVVRLKEFGTQFRKIRVMLSSRCNDEFPQNSGVRLSDVRRRLKTAIESDESFQIYGHSIFEVWINEDEPPQGGSWNSTEVCMNAVQECELLVCISNDNPGWAADNSSLGICHVELQTGLRSAPTKVRLIRLAGDPPLGASEEERKRIDLFQTYLDHENLFRGGVRPKSEDELIAYVRLTLLDTVVKFARAGILAAHRGVGTSGEALEWNRLQYSQRKQRMEEALRRAILARANTSNHDGHVWVQLGEKEVLTVLHAIPDSLTVSEAAELVGRPFHRDHLYASTLSTEKVGPVHVIACFKSATESQARRVLGFPDATVVPGPYGVWVADSIQNVQFAFLTSCSDEQNIRYGVQQFFEWLENSGEERMLAQRAESRTRIVQAIALEAVPK